MSLRKDIVSFWFWTYNRRDVGVELQAPVVWSITLLFTYRT